MLDAIMGRLNLFGTVVEFTRQEAAIVYSLQCAPCTSSTMCRVLFGDEPKRGKILGVHLCNIRKKLPDGVAIKFDAIRGVYELNSRIAGGEV